MNEYTSKQVASIAGKILANLHHITDPEKDFRCRCAVHEAVRTLGVTVGQLRALAGSCLTQAKDKPKRKV